MDIDNITSINNIMINRKFVNLLAVKSCEMFRKGYTFISEPFA